MKVVNIEIGSQKKYSDWIQTLNHRALVTETMNIILLASSDINFDSELDWKRLACYSEWLRRVNNDTQY